MGSGRTFLKYLRNSGQSQPGFPSAPIAARTKQGEQEKERKARLCVSSSPRVGDRGRGEARTVVLDGCGPGGRVRRGAGQRSDRAGGREGGGGWVVGGRTSLRRGC